MIYIIVIKSKSISFPISPATVCARDQKLYNTEGLAHSLQCGGNGNYYTKQDINGDLFCVDRDGYTVRNNVTLYEECEKYIYYSAVMQ